MVPERDNIDWFRILSSNAKKFKPGGNPSTNAARTVESVSTIDLALWQKIAGII